jgi:integrase/recombinase XerC
MKEIQPFRPPLSLADFPDPGRPSIRDIDIFGALLTDAKNRNTQEARAYDMSVLAQYLGLSNPSDAATLLCGGTAGQANAIALGFKRWLIDQGKASGTINRRICTIRKQVTLARRLGVIAWFLEIQSLPDEAARDMAGPSDEEWRKILQVATIRAESGQEIGVRDLAIIRLMHDNGLRCGEVCALDIVDLDLKGNRVGVVGKGKRSREWITINRPTAEALAGWLAIRNADLGPVFVRMTKVRDGGMWGRNATGSMGGGRLVTRGLYRVVSELGKAAGVECRPHGLRHSGATRLLDLTNGDIRAVQKWTRHKSVETVLKYDDCRRDLAGDLARKLGEDD